MCQIKGPKELKRKKSIENSPPQAKILKKCTFASNFGKFSRHAELNLGGVLPPSFGLFQKVGGGNLFWGEFPPFPPAYWAL